jgi:hypothetical protein
VDEPRADGHYAALVQRFGPFDPFAQDFAASVAALWSQWREAAEDLKDAQRRRREGRGRRPSRAVIARCQRQAWRAWPQYDGALRRLEELTAQRNGHGTASPAEDLMARLRQAPILSPPSADDEGGA